METGARNPTLAAVALQDSEIFGSLELSKIESSLSCLLLAFRRLAEKSERSEFVKALAAVFVVSTSHLGHGEKKRWLNEAEQLVTDRGHFLPTSDCR